MEFESEYYGLNIKKIKNARNNSFIFNHKLKLTIKIYSDLSRLNIGYYLIFKIPMCHEQFFRIIFQNPEYIRNFCNDLYNPLQFACRNWY